MADLATEAAEELTAFEKLAEKQLLGREAKRRIVALVAKVKKLQADLHTSHEQLLQLRAENSTFSVLRSELLAAQSRVHELQGQLDRIAYYGELSKKHLGAGAQHGDRNH